MPVHVSVIEGGKIIDYLLEKGRVVTQNDQERNFHIFYCMLTDAAQVAKYGLNGDASKHHYLNQSGVTTAPGIDDKKDWADILEGLGVMGFNSEDCANLNMFVSAVLMIGNISYTNAGGAKISDTSIVKTIASLLKIDYDELTVSLTNITRIMRGEKIATPLDPKHAEGARDSLAMALYLQLFKWVIAKINRALVGKESFHSIGVLDIFGFENFKMNYLEQFNINYANEKLQQYLCVTVFFFASLSHSLHSLLCTCTIRNIRIEFFV